MSNAALDNDDGDWPAPRTGWKVVALLCAAALASQLDRMIINLLVEPIKADLQLSDTGFAMLQGIAFGLFYVTMSVPIGWLADRFQRRLVIAGGLGLFSSFSMGTGLTHSYWPLFLTRAGVGVGEASLFPAGFSLISDHFPQHRLGRAIALFTMSSMLGTGLAYIFGGALIGFLNNYVAAHPGAFWGLKPWQLTFILIGLPGLLLTPFFLLIKEPRRRGRAAADHEKLPATLLLREVWARRGALGFMFAGFSMVALVSYAVAIWTPALFIRVYHWTPAELGLALGLQYLTFGIGGGIFAGFLNDRLLRRGILDAPLLVGAWGFVGVAVVGGVAPLMESPWLALALLAPLHFMVSMPFACAPTALQLILPNELRSQVSGLYITTITIVGLVIGPVVVAQFTDRVFEGPGAVRYSMALVIALAGPIMFACLQLARRHYRRLRQEQIAMAG